MKSNFFLVFLLLIVTEHAIAQKTKFHIVELLPNTTETKEDVDFFISEVIDNRIYKNNIGIAQKGLLNKKVLSKFGKPFEEEVLDYLKTVFPETVSGKSLVVRVNQLLISENTGAFKETGKAIISLDVLQKGVEDYFFLASFSAFREKNSMDVTGKHDDRIRAILKDCLMQFSNLDRENIKPIAVSTYLPKTPKLMVEAPGIGFFKSFTELYKNITFTDSSITFKDNRHRPQKLFLDDRIHKRALYYAYSNGENVFINASNYSGEKHFVKTKQFKNYLLFNDSFIQQDKASGASMAFGVLGLLASEQRVHVLLDLFSGQYHVLDRRTIANLLNKIEYKDLYKLYRQKPYDIEVMYSILETLSNEMGDEKLKQKFQI